MPADIEDLPGIDWKAIDEARALFASPKLSIRHAQEDQIKRVAYDFNDKKRFPKPLTRVEIIHLTDMQIGHKNFLRDRFIEYRSWILRQPYRFVLIGGDVIDAATKLSIGSPYENTMEPKGQVALSVKLLKPLADAGRILGYVGGNHERRTIPTFGDVGSLIAQNLQVPYSSGVQLIDIHFGQHDPFKISMWHGSGSAKTDGARAQALGRFMEQHASQLYLMGHLHNCVVLPKWRIERHENGLRKTKIMGIMSSSFLEYFNSYAETYALSPSETMMGRVILVGDGKWQATLR